jgi:hypothetical protein
MNTNTEKLNATEYTSEDEAVLREMRIAPARRQLGPEDLPHRPTLVSRLPIGSGHKEVRVCVYKFKSPQGDSRDQARVDVRVWNAVGKGYQPDAAGINLHASSLPILLEALRKAGAVAEAL